MNGIFAGLLLVAGLLMLQACSTPYNTSIAVNAPASLDVSWLVSDGAGGLVESGLTVDGNDEIAALMALKPAAKFPASIAVARLHDKERSLELDITAPGSIIIAPGSIEGGADHRWLSRLDMVAKAIPITEAFAETKLESLQDLRLAAKRLGIDLLLVYLIDTEHHIKDPVKDPKELYRNALVVGLTMGLLWPKTEISATSTTSGMLLDAQTGFVYGTTESTESATKRYPFYNPRTSRDSVKDIRWNIEKISFNGFVDNFKKFWKDVLAAHATPAMAR